MPNFRQKFLRFHKMYSFRLQIVLLFCLCKTHAHARTHTLTHNQSFSYETTERSIFDESGIGYTDSHIDNRIECTELGTSGKTYVQMKSEPSGGGSSPESSAETAGGPDDCAGCGRLIQVLKEILFNKFCPTGKCKMTYFFKAKSNKSFKVSIIHFVFSSFFFSFHQQGSILSLSCWEAMACCMSAL